MRLWMKRTCIACLIVPMLCTVGYAAEEASYELAFSTYFGGESWEHARKGDVCLAGRAGPGFPVSEGAFQTGYGGIIVPVSSNVRPPWAALLDCHLTY